jgi:hypothetical protein
VTRLCDDPSSKLNRLKSERTNPRGLFSVGGVGMARTIFLKCSGAALFSELGPSHRFDQIYFLSFVFFVRAADP